MAVPLHWDELSDATLRPDGWTVKTVGERLDAVIDDETHPLTAEMIPSDATSSSLDPTSATRLWEITQEMLRRVAPGTP